ncbi:tRNA/rRNA methyltransferase [Zooshikella ganghwensis]|uniref:tRNA/rRNA methyltransferase n=1 Tax=Zooshikella ganghwensis TaxID=202772 RepID=UPI000406E547|nr:tRNA/rRNA methyltransferase [Zooshikella ganghwensis]
MQISFILVEPQRAVNVGACARALKTMGFNDLRIVNSQQYLADEAQWVAHGATDILQSAQHFVSLESALKDIDLAIGTSTKQRAGKRYAYSPKALYESLSEKSQLLSRVAIVFGREDHGLANEMLNLCDVLSTVPLAVSYPSLNLGQAVMLYAYELGPLSQPDQANSFSDDVAEGQWRALHEKVIFLLDQLNIPCSAKEYQWVRERLPVCSRKDINFLHTLVTDVIRKINQ